MAFLGRLCDLFWLNLLTIICCIPIFTIGPAVTALYHMTMKMARGEEGYLTKPYLKAFKDNFGKSTIIWIVMVIAFAILSFDFYAVLIMDASYREYLLVALLIISILLGMGSAYFFPLQARFENTCLRTMKNGFLLAITHLPSTIVICLIYAMPIGIAYFVPTLLILYLLVGFSLPNYFASFFFVKIFKKLEEAQEEREEV